MGNHVGLISPFLENHDGSPDDESGGFCFGLVLQLVLQHRGTATYTRDTIRYNLKQVGTCRDIWEY